jgi:ubiquitin thioesterase protein OTUB1
MEDQAAEMNRQTEARMNEIETEIKNQPLTSDPRSISDLTAQYQTSANNFLAGIEDLEQDYVQIRIVRGDGNCYYRAFLYNLAEHMFENKQEGERILACVKKDSWDNVMKAGYDEMTIETFYDTLVDLLERLTSGATDAAAFHKEMNEESATSDYCTWYLRVVTATHLKQDPERFLPFIDGQQPGLDIQQFCQREVEPMGKECQHVQVLALAEAFGVHVKIEYLDGHDLVNGKLVQHTFGPDTAVTHLALLYRPGHYDILYPK